MRIFNVVPVDRLPEASAPNARGKLTAPNMPAGAVPGVPTPPLNANPGGEVPVIVKPFEWISPPKGATEEIDERFPGQARPPDSPQTQKNPPPDNSPEAADSGKTMETPQPPVIPVLPISPAPGAEKQKRDFLDAVQKIETQDDRFIAPRDPSLLKTPLKETQPAPGAKPAPPDLSVNSAAVGNVLKDFDRRNSQSGANLSGGIERTPFEGEGGLGGDGKSVRGGSAFFNVKGYDITPWAQRVVYRIKRNWNVPAAVQAGIQGKVGFYVVIEKDGSISHAEFREYSKILAYNEAVAAAFRSSSPLPPLPPDFPNKNLEAYFVFHYN